MLVKLKHVYHALDRTKQQMLQQIQIPNTKEQTTVGHGIILTVLQCE